MQLRTLLRIGMDYAVLGAIVFGFLLIAFLTAYFLIYKKLLKGQKRPALGRIFWWGIFLCYMIVVLGVTLLFRGSAPEAEPVYPPFYSYRDAWMHWSQASWRNIILNFCMFMPLGFLLPLRWSFFQKERRILLVGFGASLAIELMQLITHAGMFEWDDLLGNTVGSLIGYGFYLILAWLGRAVRLRRVLLAQIPLLIVTAVFACIFLKYQNLELGTHPDSCILPYDTDLIKVTLGSDLSQASSDQMVYQLQVLTPATATAIGEKIFMALGTHVDQSRTTSYENVIVLNSEDNQYSVWVDYKGGTYRFTNYKALFPKENAEAAAPVHGASQEEIRNALEQIGIYLPKGSSEQITFRELTEDFYESGWYAFTAHSLPYGDSILDGTFSCQYYGDGIIGQATNQFKTCKPYKEYPLLSEQEAYDALKEGKFFYRGKESLDIALTDCQLIYVADSKGFYQPTYEFEGTLNGRDAHIRIPALRKYE